jgi:hypothetical protein
MSRLLTENTTPFSRNGRASKSCYQHCVEITRSPTFTFGDKEQHVPRKITESQLNTSYSAAADTAAEILPIPHFETTVYFPRNLPTKNSRPSTVRSFILWHSFLIILYSPSVAHKKPIILHWKRSDIYLFCISSF